MVLNVTTGRWLCKEFHGESISHFQNETQLWWHQDTFQIDCGRKALFLSPMTPYKLLPNTIHIIRPEIFLQRVSHKEQIAIKLEEKLFNDGYY